MQTAAVTLRHDRLAQLAYSWPRMLVWSSLILYPFVPWLLTESWKLSSALAVLALVWSVSGPVAAWFSIRAKPDRATGSAIVLEAIAATVAPPFFAIFGVALSRAGWLPYRTYIWFALLAVVAGLAKIAPGAVVTARRHAAIRRMHYAAALPLFVFLFAHVANHLMAIDSYDAHVHVQNVLRVVYRNGIVEPLLVVAVIVQVVTGAMLVWNVRGSHFTSMRALQFVSGAYLSMFFFSHVNAVLVFGRWLQGADTTFQWATGGRAGLLASGSAALLPYYVLSVFAFFMHAACAGRWALGPVVGNGGAQRVAWVVGTIGCLVTLALLAPLTGFRFH
jgi:hypothetical protein